MKYFTILLIMTLGFLSVKGHDPKINLNRKGYRLERLKVIAINGTNLDVIGDSSDIDAPLRLITGNVVDENGQPLQGVSVTLKNNPNKATITDNKGNFSIEANSGDVLEFSFVGFKTVRITLKDNSNSLKIRMENDLVNLGEVVLIGYGQVKQKDLTGSVSSIKASEIVKSTDISLNAALQGRAAGVQVTSAEGAPGADVSISIRAGSSIAASNEPLYVIDGFPQFGGSNLNINPNDVASIEILKDASATAIYGSRGANGVIIITTKSGKAGKFNLSYDGYVGYQELGVKRKVINSEQYAQMEHYFATEDRNSEIGDSVWNNWQSFKDTASINWQDKIFRKALMQGHNISFTGGTENLKISGSLGYTGQNGIAVGTSYDRYTARLNAITTISKRITNGTTIYLSNSVRKGSSLKGNGGITYSILKGSPYKPADVQSLNDYLGALGGPGGSNGEDPYIELTQTDIATHGYSGSVNTYFSIKLLDELTFKVAGGVEYNSSYYDYFEPSTTRNGWGLGGAGGNTTQSSISLLNENTLSYNKTFNEVHKLEAVAGFTMQTEASKENDINVSDFPIQSLGYNNLGFANTIYPSISNKAKSGLVSYLGRVNYSYLDKYLLTASMRADGSSKFPKNRWGYFPSGAFAWKIDQENFMHNIAAISTLKLRTSWGMTGNQSVPPYSSYSTFDNANNSLPPVFFNQTVVGLAPTQLGTTDLKWETTIQTDLGIDLGILKDRVFLTVDAYKKKSKDLLLKAPLVSYSGFAVTDGYTPSDAFVYRNIGDIQVKGMEFNLNTVNLDGKFKWRTNFNIAFNRSKVLSLNEGQTNFKTGRVARFTTPYQVKVGEPLGSFYGYVYDGIIHTQEQLVSGPSYSSLDATVGTRAFKDLNHDGVINGNDRTILGNGNPKYFGGINNEFSYGSFELSFLFTYSYGNDVLNAQKALLETPGPYQGNLATSMQHWTPDNPQVNAMRWYGNYNYMNEYDALTSYLIEDGSYLRLKNVMIGYNTSPALLKKLKIQALRIYISGQNLLTFTHYTGYDPEANYLNSIVTPGADLGAYPRSKIYTVGLNATF